MQREQQKVTKKCIKIQFMHIQFQNSEKCRKINSINAEKLRRKQKNSENAKNFT
jgi:hypothetical protein